MARLLIGVPARNEAERIVELADRIEAGATMLRSDDECHLALAYQQSDDDTLARFTSRRPSRFPQVVLQSRLSRVGKGANVKLLVQQALSDGVDFLLLVDADLGGYDPCNLVRVRRRRRTARTSTWSCRCGPGPVVRATPPTTSPARWCSRRHRARIRQPLAGHMLLHRSLLEQLDVDALPDDYGIDITITLSALACDARIGQVRLVAPEHPSKEGNSERVMVEVATAGSARSTRRTVDRPDVVWPDRYWAGWEWPRNGGIEADHVDVILQHAGSDAELETWLELSDASDDEVAEMWCDHLADAVAAAGLPTPTSRGIVNDLICPFFVHAEHRARQGDSVEELELYVADLGLRLAARLHG